MKPCIVDFNDEEDEALAKMEEVKGKKNEREFSLWAKDGYVYVIDPHKTQLTKKGACEYGAAVYRIGRGLCRRVNTFTGKTLSEPSPSKLVEYIQAWMAEAINGGEQWLKMN